LSSDFFFQSGSEVLRVGVVGVLAYLALVVLLRGAGPRALSKLNGFDFVVTVALGSTLATILLSSDVALVEGVTAFVVLLALQYAVTWLSVRSQTVSDLVKSEPVLVLYEGKMLRHQMARARVVPVEIEAVIRQTGSASVESVYAVVLETDGSLSVIESAPDAAPDMIERLQVET
jgi:uncharacterized membrane protein YcaP (DUF421 family)